MFVLDVSGSMANDGKLRLSRDSIGAFIDALGDEDRFEVITFNIAPRLAVRQLSRRRPTRKRAGAHEFLALAAGARRHGAATRRSTPPTAIATPIGR